LSPHAQTRPIDPVLPLFFNTRTKALERNWATLCRSAESCRRCRVGRSRCGSPRPPGMLSFGSRSSSRRSCSTTRRSSRRGRFCLHRCDARWGHLLPEAPGGGMSVNHSWFGPVAVKFRWTWSSWTGGPALSPRPRFFANTGHKPLLGAQPPEPVLTRLQTRMAEFVGDEPVAERGVVRVGIPRRLGQVSFVLIPLRDRASEPLIEGLCGEVQHRFPRTLRSLPEVPPGSP